MLLMYLYGERLVRCMCFRYMIYNIINIQKIHQQSVLSTPSKIQYTVKPVSRGHLRDKKKWPYKTGYLLKDVQLI